MLFHFFGTLMRDFELQHSGHPRFSASPAAAVVQQMGHYDSLRRVQSRRSRPRAVGRGRRLFCVRHHPPRVHRRVERCALALEPAPAAHTVPVLTACARRARAHRPAAECADAAGTVCGHARLFCGAGAGATAVAANRALYLLEKVTPPLRAPALFGRFLNARLSACHAACALPSMRSTRPYVCTENLSSFRPNGFPRSSLQASSLPGQADAYPGKQRPPQMKCWLIYLLCACFPQGCFFGSAPL